MELDLTQRSAAFAALGEPHRLTIVDALRFTDLTPGHLAEVTGLPTNLLAHHLRLLEEAGLVSRTQSEGDRRRRYVTLASARLTALFAGERARIASIAFVCTQNSARSPFAAARYSQLTGLPATSAGTRPATAVHPEAVRSARRYGVDLSNRVPQDYTRLEHTDTVISVCDRALEHGLPPHRRHLHWSIPDPDRRGDSPAFEEAFARIDERIARLLPAAP